MYYQSTRNQDLRMNSMEIIKQGISHEGGLFVPIEIPKLTKQDFHIMMDMDYKQRAFKVLSLFLTDYPEDELWNIITSSYRDDNFDSEEIAPIVHLGDELFVQELWHGPTCAFKDMALQILPHLMTAAIQYTDEEDEIVILVATSGDTGKAALEGFKDVEGTHIIVFYPDEGVSPIQKLQMVTQEGENTYVAAVKGNFDDAQTGVKSIFGDRDLAHKLKDEGLRFSSANSINWGRLVPQIVYYVSAYLDLMKRGSISKNEEFNIVVPTGNFGNILAAYYARAMGVPIGRLICASNSNKVLEDFINTGVYDRKREFYKTISPSMDILISSNLERLLFELAGKQAEPVKQWMEDLQNNGKYSLDPCSLERLQTLFWGGYASEGETLEAIKTTYNRYNYMLDPHTGVGKRVYDVYKKETGDTRNTILVSTASPFKFAGDVLKAILGEKAVENKDEFTILDILGTLLHQEIPKGLKNLNDKPVLHSTLCGKNEMSNIVKQLLDLGGIKK